MPPRAAPSATVLAFSAGVPAQPAPMPRGIRPRGDPFQVDRAVHRPGIAIDTHKVRKG